jgi:TolA-binding protein
MTLPIHTVKHIKASYRKIQIITICFTVLTLAAALLAALSGIQLVNLEKQQSAEIVQTAPPPAVVDDNLNKQIEDLQTELAKEKNASKKLESRIADLNKQITSLKKVNPAPRQPGQTSEPSTKIQTPSSPAPVKKTVTPPTSTPKPAPAAIPDIMPTKIEPVAPKPGATAEPEAPAKTADTPSTEATETPLVTKPSVETTPPAEQKPKTNPSTTLSITEPAQSTEPPAPAQVPEKANEQSGGQVPSPASSDQKVTDSQQSTSPDSDSIIKVPIKE